MKKNRLISVREDGAQTESSGMGREVRNVSVRGHGRRRHKGGETPAEAAVMSAHPVGAGHESAGASDGEKAKRDRRKAGAAVDKTVAAVAKAGAAASKAVAAVAKTGAAATKARATVAKGGAATTKGGATVAKGGAATTKTGAATTESSARGVGREGAGAGDGEKATRGRRKAGAATTESSARGVGREGAGAGEKATRGRRKAGAATTESSARGVDREGAGEKAKRGRRKAGATTTKGGTAVAKAGAAVSKAVAAVAKGGAKDGRFESAGAGARRGGRRPASRADEPVYTYAAGAFTDNGKYGSVVANAGRRPIEILIPKKHFGGASSGDTVVAEITGHAGAANMMEGCISEIISRAGEPGGDILAVIRQHGLSKGFPERVQRDADAIPDEIRACDLEGRRDLRYEKIFTIDGADSKDFDDAVSIKGLAGGRYRLGVHIADVSHYVTEGGALDREALKRGTSIYLLDQVAPMLPVSISNGICSLNEGVDRLTLSVDMIVGPSGEVEDYEIYESVIRSKARLVYGDVSDLLEAAGGGAASRPTDPPDGRALSGAEKCAALRDELLLMGELAEILYECRKARGSIEFDIDEANIRLGGDGAPIHISVAERRAANKMIEEFMLLANETVAKRYHGKRIPFVYRVHEKPDAEKLAEFRKFLEGIGVSMKGGAIRPRPSDFNSLLEQIKGRPEENVINMMMLRTMKKACYSAECDGHFGLSLKYYCHFTSPIRRYPDLMIHRIIKESMRGAIKSKRREELKKMVIHAAEKSSETEMGALELEREVAKMKKAEYMQSHLGEEFDAVISGVVSFGFFVGLPNTVEGLVRVDRLRDDYYVHEPERYRLVGESTGKTWTLGDTVRVTARSADSLRREVDFELVSDEAWE
ncbi:MAG: ribonuclease R, partial [Clostridiales Family XIII bacterium]|nr:ribonuclease R [Clostridiales Family XIII bacterium]